MTPIIKVGYYKDQLDNFGLNLTVLKAEYQPSLITQVRNDAWMMDSNTSGSPGEETRDSVPMAVAKEECMIVL